ncbi:MAG: PEP-CTERM sorting domain-containing protein [Candidatus Brocadiae bacterium]|nr:PEP-CTERM sorting domain-containing protein [Candidatus Brocadiia bacterium]
MACRESTIDYTAGPPDTYTIVGSGGDIWGTADGFHYVYQSVSGDFMAAVRLVSQQNTNGWAKAGLMARADLDSDGIDNNDAHVNISATPSNGVVLQYRDTEGGGSGGATIGGAPSSTSAPYWLYLKRSGNVFTVQWAPDSGGSPDWTGANSLSHTSPNMGSDIVLGMHVTSHNDGTTSQVVFQDVAILGGWEARAELAGADTRGRVQGRAFGQTLGGGALLGSANWRIDYCQPHTTAGLRAEWFTNQSFTDPVAFDVVATEVNRNDYQYPGTGWTGNHDDFSVRYSGMFYADHAGTYGFQEQVDDEAWIDIDGVEVLHDGTWDSHTSATTALDEGWHLIEFRQREGGGGDFARLLWDPENDASFSIMTAADADFRTGYDLVALGTGYGAVGDLGSDDLFGVELPYAQWYLLSLQVDYLGETTTSALLNAFGAPEPGTMTLLALGGLSLWRRRRRRK